MLTGELKSQVDKVWDAFWTGGISNPLTVIEQITYLLFIKRLDEIHTLKEKKANRFNEPIQDPVFTTEQNELRWSKFKELNAEEMFNVVREKVFPFIKNIGFFQITDETLSNLSDKDYLDSLKTLLNKVFNNRITFENELRKNNITDPEQIKIISEKSLKNQSESTYSKYMKDALFMIQTPALLEKVIEMISKIPMEDMDTKGNIYEYLLSKLTTAGVNGQFRTPRHIIKMIVELVKPEPKDIICDPACGTAGFLVSVGEYLQDKFQELQTNSELREHYNNKMFHGFDFDTTMLRIGTMNMILHGVENPNILYRDSLSEINAEHEEDYTLILANPPFKGSLDDKTVAKNLTKIVNTKKTELLFLALIIRMLKTGGRCAVIVPDGVLFGSSNAHIAIRKEIVENHKLEAIISLPSGVFKPYAGVSTGVLIFTKTGTGGTDKVWFYDMLAEGFSLDDKRSPLGEKIQEDPPIYKTTHEQNNISDVINRWNNLKEEESRARTEQSFLVSKDDIVNNKYDLSINRYKEVVHEETSFEAPRVLLERIIKLENELKQELEELELMI
ncbi:MAG: class I SAM-dependent DNA methyltransferase [Candidatus Sericytochromatia bacterium]